MNVSDELQRAIDDTQARIRFRFPIWLRPFVVGNVVAITLGRRIYVTASMADDRLERLLRHELEHVRQVNRLGVVRFYVRYVLEYIRNRRAGMTAHDAYRNISFEREAWAAEEGHGELDV